MTLTNDAFIALFGSPCHYCGAAPSNVARHESRHGVYLYSGIDRISSSIGYEPGNVRPCCWVCNRMKHVLSESEFVSHIRRILAHLER